MSNVDEQTIEQLRKGLKQLLELSSDATYGGTPLGWAMHGSEHGWNCNTGDYAALLEPGAKRLDKVEGSAAAHACATVRRISRCGTGLPQSADFDSRTRGSGAGQGTRPTVFV